MSSAWIPTQPPRCFELTFAVGDKILVGEAEDDPGGFDAGLTTLDSPMSAKKTWQLKGQRGPSTSTMLRGRATFATLAAGAGSWSRRLLLLLQRPGSGLSLGLPGRRRGRGFGPEGGIGHAGPAAGGRSARHGFRSQLRCGPCVRLLHPERAQSAQQTHSRHQQTQDSRT